jgi:hypothetical protein
MSITTRDGLVEINPQELSGYYANEALPFAIRSAIWPTGSFFENISTHTNRARIEIRRALREFIPHCTLERCEIADETDIKFTFRVDGMSLYLYVDFVHTVSEDEE